MTIAVSQPRDGEFSPAHARYIERIGPIADAAGLLEGQSNRLVRQVAALTDEQGEYRYADGKWSIKEVLGHVADTERVFAYRLLRIARGDETPLPGFDENTYVPAAQCARRTMADIIEEWIAVRSATVALVRGLPPEAWGRRGTASGMPLSARAALYVLLGHVDHHQRLLEDRYGIAP